jgi:CspA family cold shock protein
MKINYNDGYFKFEMDEGDYTYQGSCRSINEAKEMFLQSLSDKIDKEVGRMLTSRDKLTTDKSNDIAGKVKWFNSEKGYGFIEYDGGDVFAHFQEIKCDGFKNLDEGEDVIFEISNGARGSTAINIRRVRDFK